MDIDNKSAVCSSEYSSFLSSPDMSCDHEHVNDGYCEDCGLMLYSLDMDRSNTAHSEKASITEYIFYVNNLSSLPEWIKGEVIELLYKQNSFSNKIETGKALIYSLVKKISAQSKHDDDDPFSLPAFQKELKLSKRKVNQIKKTNANEFPPIEIHHPVKFVKKICKLEEHEELEDEIKSELKRVINFDKTFRLLEICPEYVALAMYKLISNKHNVFISKGFCQRQGIAENNLKKTLKLVSHEMEK